MGVKRDMMLVMTVIPISFSLMQQFEAEYGMRSESDFAITSCIYLGFQPSNVVVT